MIKVKIEIPFVLIFCYDKAKAKRKVDEKSMILNSVFNIHFKDNTPYSVPCFGAG